jgi:hypothetical protein
MQSGQEVSRCLLIARRDRPKMLDYTKESLDEITLAIEREVAIAFHFPI